MSKQNKKQKNKKNENLRSQPSKTLEARQTTKSDEINQELLSRAIVDALSKMRLEKVGEDYVFITQEILSKENEQDTSVVKRILLLMEILVFPFGVCKRRRVNGKLHDVMLSAIVGALMQSIGFFVWFFGIACVVWGVSTANPLGLLGIFTLLIGSILITSAESFKQERDSNKIYAFSASILALLSCIASWIVLYISM